MRAFIALTALSILLFSITPSASQTHSGLEIVQSTAANLLSMKWVDDRNPIRIPAPSNSSSAPQAAAATSIVFNYLPPGGGYYGDVCATFPATAKVAFEYAASLAAQRFSSSVPIKIDACWATNLPSLNTLGRGGPIGIARGGVLPVSNTWYSYALANALSGSDLSPSQSDIYISFNANRTDWYMGADGLTPNTSTDFVTVCYHEIFHGLGFVPSFYYSSGVGNWGDDTFPFIFDRFVYNGLGQRLIDAYTSGTVALGSQLVSGNIYFRGANAQAANGGVYPKLYAPAVYSQGSSISHLDYATFSGSELMVYAVGSGQSKHSPGPVSMGVMQDLGWAASVPAGMTITMGKSAYVNSEVVTATEFRLQNLGPVAVALEIKVWLEVPGANPIPILNAGADGALLLPAGFNQNFGPLPLFAVSSSLPRGTYQFNARAVNPVTGATISEDLNSFLIQ